LLTKLVNEVFKTGGALLQIGDALVEDEGLTASRWLVLGRLEDGPTTVATLARDRGLRRQSVQESMNRLSLDGYVSRATNPHDRRAPLWSLTPAGRDALDTIEPARHAWAMQTSTQIPASKINTAIWVLNQLCQSGAGADAV